jgi:hypothetical protein
MLGNFEPYIGTNVAGDITDHLANTVEETVVYPVTHKTVRRHQNKQTVTTGLRL